MSANAIERLGEFMPAPHGDGSYDLPTCPCRDCSEKMEFITALAAVEALYQAAKAVCDRPVPDSRLYEAVRRVETGQ